MKVSISAPSRSGSGVAPPPLLSVMGPEVVLGGHDPMMGPLKPSPESLYGPRGALLVGAEGPLWVADTGHHRVLGWLTRPERDGTPADLVLGQPSFENEGRNAGRERTCPDTMDMPVGIAELPGGGLAICDSWNHRVLIYRGAPRESGVAADVVIGQASLEDGLPNRGRDAPRADTLHWPFAVLVHAGWLWVADAGNRRVLGYRGVPDVNGAPADLVLGQPTFEERSDNGGGPADARSVRWPHDLAIFNGDLCVADAGNNRVLVWDGVPVENYASAGRVLGQASFDAVDHNAGTYGPTARSLNMPYGLATVRDSLLLVADTANSRLLGISAPLSNYREAECLTGQETFEKKGDNRWQAPVRDSLCWPYGLRVTGGTVVVADTGNHRAALWSLAGG